MNETVYLAVGIASLIGILGIISQLRTDVARNKMILEKIADKLGVSLYDKENLDNELKKLISDGKKTKAISRFRIVTGHGLKEAKEYVDLLSEEKTN